MRSPFSKKPDVSYEFLTREQPLFVLIYQQIVQDYVVLQKAIYREMRPLERFGVFYLPWINLLAIPWLFTRFQQSGLTSQFLIENWLSFLMLAALSNFLYQQRRNKRMFIRFVQNYPHRALFVYKSGCLLFASDEQGNILEPPVLLYRSLWRDMKSYENSPERAIIVDKRNYAILISNRITACSCDVHEASQILDNLLAPSSKPNMPPIAEP